MSPLLGSLSGVSAKAFGMLASAIKPIQDLFTRTTSGSLGTATSGQNWVATRGTWSANGTQATSADAASNYPLASISHKSNTTIKADTTGGVGAAFWVNGSSDWWAGYPFYSSSESSTATCNAGYTTSSSNTIFCGGYTTNPSYTLCNTNLGTGLSDTSTCCEPSAATTTVTRSCPPGLFLCDGGNLCRSDANCLSNIVQGSSSVTTYNCYRGTTSYPATYSGYTTTTSSTVTTYSTSIRIISSVSGSVVTDSTTSLTSNTSAYTNLASMEITTSENAITAKGYSSAGQVTQLGSTVTRTPSSPNRGSGVGIIKAPTTANQGSTLDNFSATI
jgi:hypothetical protein